MTSFTFPLPSLKKGPSVEASRYADFRCRVAAVMPASVNGDVCQGSILVGPTPCQYTVHTEYYDSQNAIAPYRSSTRSRSFRIVCDHHKPYTAHPSGLDSTHTEHYNIEPSSTGFSSRTCDTRSISAQFYGSMKSLAPTCRLQFSIDLDSRIVRNYIHTEPCKSNRQSAVVPCFVAATGIQNHQTSLVFHLLSTWSVLLEPPTVSTISTDGCPKVHSPASCMATNTPSKKPKPVAFFAARYLFNQLLVGVWRYLPGTEFCSLRSTTQGQLTQGGALHVPHCTIYAACRSWPASDQR